MRYTKNNKNLPWLFLLFFLTIGFSSKAVHVAGGNITYKWIKSVGAGIHTYEITMYYYTYCAGAEDYDNCSDVAFDPDNSPTTLTICSKSRSPQCIDLYPILKRKSCKEITEYCPGKLSRCQSGGTLYGVSEWIFSGEVDIEEQPDWVISISIQNRNTTTATMKQMIYLETRFTNVGKYATNSSPVFSNSPIIQPVLNHKFTYNHGASDPDGNDLEYKIIEPRKLETSPITYNSPYSYLEPFGPTAPLTFSGSNGTFSATPTSVMSTIMAIQVNETDNGTVISSIVRDIQINVSAGNNANPELSEINNIPGNGYTIVGFVDVPLTFTITATDEDIPDQIVSFEDNNIPDAFAAIPDADKPEFVEGTPGYTTTATFSWAKPQVGEYCFTVTVKDNACDVNENNPGRTTQSYCIIIENTPCSDCPNTFSPVVSAEYIISGWVKEIGIPNATTYDSPEISLEFPYTDKTAGPFKASGNIIDGWQRVEGKFIVPSGAWKISVVLNNSSDVNDVLFDDIRLFPAKGTMKGFVYDPVTRKLMAELDERNYATFYEYNEEGALVRVKKETERGKMTIQESRSSSAKKQ